MNDEQRIRGTKRGDLQPPDVGLGARSRLRAGTRVTMRRHLAALALCCSACAVQGFAVLPGSSASRHHRSSHPATPCPGPMSTPSFVSSPACPPLELRPRGSLTGGSELFMLAGGLGTQVGGKSVRTDTASLFQTLRTTRLEEEVLAVIAQLVEGERSLNVKDYTSILAALKRFKNWKEALEVFGRMQERGVEPNAITYNAVMGACGAAGRWKETQELFQTMIRRGLRPDAVSYGSLMIGFVRGGQWEQALDVLGQMKAQRMDITEGVYTTGITACEKGGQWVLALELLREMHLKGISPSLFAYNAAIFACRRDKQWVQATALLGEMRQDGLIPDRNSYHGAMATCEEAEMWEGVMDLYEELRAMGLEPSRQSYEYVTRACREYLTSHGEDERLKNYLRVNKISPNVLTDESDVIFLAGAKILEYEGGQESSESDLEEQPTWMSFADDE